MHGELVATYIQCYVLQEKYHFFYLIQYPVKANIIASTVQCHTKLMFKFTQQIHTQYFGGARKWPHK